MKILKIELNLEVQNEKPFKLEHLVKSPLNINREYFKEHY
jgi:hypothetical protein